MRFTNLVQSGKRGLRCLVENFQKHLCSTGWTALALLPITDSVQGNINTLSKLRLTECRRPRRANFAASNIASASSAALCLAMSASVVASTRRGSIRPDNLPVGFRTSIFIRTVFIAFYLTSIGFSGGNDPDDITTQCIHEQEQPLAYAADQLITILLIAVSGCLAE